MGPRFFKAVEEQVRREEEERKRLPLGQMLDPSAVQRTTLVQSCALPSAVHCTMIRRTPIKDSESSSSSTPPPRAGDDDDVSLRSQESGGSKQEAKLIPDAEGLDMVCRVACKCGKLPGAAAKFRAATELGYRSQHDWRLLAAAVVRLDAKVAAGECKPGNAASVAVKMLAEMRSKKFPSAELDALYAIVDRLLEPTDEEVKFRATVHDWVVKGLAKGDPPARVEAAIKDYMVKRGDSQVRFRWAQDELLKLFKEAS